MPVFGTASKNSLAKAHPLLQQLCNEAIKRVDFKVLDSQRGRDAQELAFRKGNTKAHFGQSAHNYSPAIAVDLFPAPYDWNNEAAFDNMNRIIGWYDPASGKGLGLAKELGIPIRAGWDWNMDFSKSDGWDKPHIELHPWREWAKKVKLYKGR